jgi:DNA primase large subunit
MEITSDKVLSLVQEAFESSIKNRDNISENSKRSSYFVSQLAKSFADFSQGGGIGTRDG